MPSSTPMTTARKVNSAMREPSGTKGLCSVIVFLRLWRRRPRVGPRRSLLAPTIAWTVRHRHIMTARRGPIAAVRFPRPMKNPRLLLAAAAVAACGPLCAAEPAQPVPPRFSVGYMDTGVDPRADFARYAFGAWQKKNPVPPDKARWGSFNELDQFNQLALRGILEAAAAGPHKPGSVEQKVGDFFKSAMDTAAIDAAGLKPVEADIARLAAIASTAELARALANMHNLGVGGFFRVFVEADEKNSEVNALYAYQGGMSLPSKGYYFDEQFGKIRAAFVEHAAKMLTLAGDTPEAAAAGAKTVFEVEKALAAGAKTPVELRDPLANYNKMPTAELATRLPLFALYLAERGIAGPAAGDIIVGQPKFFEACRRSSPRGR